MAHMTPHTIPAENMYVLKQQKKMQKGSPKTGHKIDRRSNMSNTKTTPSATRTGDAVSDESDSEDAGGGSSAAEDDGDDSDDDPDDRALPSVKRIKNDAGSRLAGLLQQSHALSGDDSTVAGAEPDSEEENYLAVDDISDSEASVDEMGDDNVLRSAEKDLIAEFERSERPSTANGVTNDMDDMSLTEDAALARRLSLQSDDSQQDDLGHDLDFSQDPFVGMASSEDLYTKMLGEAEESFDRAVMYSWRIPESSPNVQNGATLATAQKKVRFEETASSRASSESSDEDPRDTYPDLFDDHDDPALRQQIQLSGMDMDLAHDNESLYDFEFEDEYERAAFEIDGQSDSDSDSEMCDDSEDGDTTDEETAEEQLARVAKIKESKKGAVPSVGALQAAPSTPAPSKASSPTLSRSDSNATNSQFATPKTAGRPKAGTFANDPTRASITADIKGSGVKLVCPTKPPEKDREYWERARQAMGSRDGSPGGSVSWTRAAPRAASIPQRPFTVRSTLGTMFDGNLDFLRSNDEHGIAKDFFTTSRKNSLQSSLTSNTPTDGDGSDESSNVNMADFVQLDDLDSDMEDESVNDVMTPVQQAFISDAVLDSSPTATRDNAPGLLDHFDQQRGLVSSFRNNQHHARHVSSLAAHPSQRAQTSEANALQKGRRAAANTPMTPARKKRQDLDVTGAGIKKTASPSVQKHRRSRGNSLSGIQQTLALDRFNDKNH